jgi:hypothetical protein
VNEHRFEQRGRPRHEINVVFHVEPAGGLDTDAPPVLTSPEEHLELVWADLASIVDLDLRPPVLKAWLLASQAGGEPVGSENLEGRLEWISHTDPSFRPRSG